MRVAGLRRIDAPLAGGGERRRARWWRMDGARCSDDRAPIGSNGRNAEGASTRERSFVVSSSIDLGCRVSVEIPQDTLSPGGASRGIVSAWCFIFLFCFLEVG